MKLEFFDLGLIHYKDSYDFQIKTYNKVKSKELDHALISCSHYPVITLGRQAKPGNLLVSEDELKKRKIELFNIERGGDITYHGPGQLTVYPIFNLGLIRKDIHFFIRSLENIIINTLGHFKIKAGRREALTGVWVKNEKVASIGISIKHWITYHGLTINVKKADLDNFRLIRPCGMDIMMTSMESISGEDIDIKEVSQTLNKEIAKWPK